VPLFGFGRGPGGPEFHHFGPFGGLEAAASYLNLTRAELDTRLRNGNTLAAIAKAEDKSVSGLVDAMYTAAKQQLDAAGGAGRLTQAQEAQILADLKSRLGDFVNGKSPPFDRDGRGLRGGPAAG